jgi:hypothetical protein
VQTDVENDGETTGVVGGARRVRIIPILWADLEVAFERNAADIISFLDLTTGGVLTITHDDPASEESRARIAARPAGFQKIDPASSREQYRWMERFVASVTDEPLRERLLIAIDGKGAFRRFKDVLLAYPAERERWFTYRTELLRYQMQVWLEQVGLQPREPPPWGKLVPPPDPAPASAVAAKSISEAPGEILRRQAKELIDGIAAMELPAALAFLEFLRDRSTTSLLTPHGGLAGVAAAKPASDE